jgi:hypothetical protein
MSRPAGVYKAAVKENPQEKESHGAEASPVTHAPMLAPIHFSLFPKLKKELAEVTLATVKFKKVRERLLRFTPIKWSSL